MTNDVKPQVIVMDLYMRDETSFTPEDVKSHLKDRSELLAISLSNDKDAKALAEDLIHAGNGRFGGGLLRVGDTAAGHWRFLCEGFVRFRKELP
jgi:hypothetical protein